MAAMALGMQASMSCHSFSVAHAPSPVASQQPIASQAPSSRWSAPSMRNVNQSRSRTEICARKRMFDDPEYDSDLENGDLMSYGKQDLQEPRPPTDTTSDQGFLTFPKQHNPEIASLGLYIRNDVRRLCLLVSGGVYENLLAFQLITFLKDRYPGVRIDVVAPPRGKQTYELNKNVRRALVYDVDDPYIEPVVFTETLGRLKNENYDMVLSTKPAGIGMALFMWMTDARQRVSYVYNNVNGAGTGAFLSTVVRAPADNLSELGFSMYSELTAAIDDGNTERPSALEVAVPAKVQEAANAKLSAAGVKKGAFVLLHGVESPSPASMQSKGDVDSLLPITTWVAATAALRMDVLWVLPNERVQEQVQEVVGPLARTVVITTPGQLAAAIRESAGVVTTNTAAVQLAVALKTPSVALFGSADKAGSFLPVGYAETCTVVASQTGRLADVSVPAVEQALSGLASKSLVSA